MTSVVVVDDAATLVGHWIQEWTKWACSIKLGPSQTNSFDGAVPMMHQLMDLVDDEPIAIITTWAVLHRQNCSDWVSLFQPRPFRVT